jgi:hypothetical protein
MFRKALFILGKCNQKPEVHFPHNKIDSIVLLRILTNQCNCQSYNCQIKSWVQRDLQIMNFTHKLQSKQKLMYTAKKFDIHTASQYDSIHIWELPMHVRKILQEIYVFLYLEIALHSAVLPPPLSFFHVTEQVLWGKKI